MTSLLIVVLAVQNWMINASGKHVGLLRFFVEYLMQCFRLSSTQVSAEQMLHCLMSANLVEHLNTMRIIPKSLTSAQYVLVETILLHGAAYPENKAELEAAAKLVLIGVVVYCTSPQERGIEFTAPAIQLALLARFLRPAPGTHELSDQLPVFLYKAIGLLNPSELANTLNRSIAAKRDRSAVLECQWQHAFYLAASRALPANFIISPDVGAIFDSCGRLDFYINSDRCWGIELIREGDRREEHLARFLPADAQTGRAAGIYYGMVSAGIIKDWVVIDFLAQRRIKRKPHHEKLWFVYHSQDFMEFEVHTYNSTTTIHPQAGPNALVGSRRHVRTPVPSPAKTTPV